jgi:hypothetical protein
MNLARDLRGPHKMARLNFNLLRTLNGEVINWQNTHR